MALKRKVAVKIPASVRRKLEEVAEKNNASVNDIIVAGIKIFKN
jgi:Arc-like DNA binding domain.